MIAAALTGASGLGTRPQEMTDLAEPLPGSVLVLEVEVGTANGSGQLRLLRHELELRRELSGDRHPFGELEPDRPLLGVVDGVITLIDRPLS